MISLVLATEIHQKLIQRFGGAYGIRDHSALSSALSRPFQTFEEKELYPTVLDKAAALIESILSNHPFVDGNKRTGYVLLRAFLLSENLDITATEDEKYEFIIQIASGSIKYDSILEWLHINTADAETSIS